MNFRRPAKDEPEINLIPFIDVLLVVLIFLMLSTTYAKITELKITLPSANADSAQDYPTEVTVTVSSDGRYAVNQLTLPTPSIEALTLAMTEASKGNKEAIVIIHADALSTHQSVISVLDAARASGLPKVTFASQKSNTNN
jgi:biopolymer transport protein ExbD